MKSTRKHPKRIAILGNSVLKPRSVFNEVVVRYGEEHGHWDIAFSGEATVKTFRFLRELDCDGAIVRISTPEMREEALRTRFPIVNISGWLEDAGVPSVRSDEDAIGRVCAEHLLDRGFRRFGIVQLWGGWFTQARSNGFFNAIKAKGYGENTSIFEAHTASISSRQEMARFRAWVLTMRPPAALFFTDDVAALPLVEACLAAGLRIPHDIAVIVGHWPDHRDSFETSLTHVDPALDTSALEAARYLDRLMEGKARGPKAIWVPPRGVVSQRSTDTLAVDDPMVARAVEFIREHSSENINVKVIVERLSVCRRTLQKHFVGAMGISLHQFLLRQRIAQADNLLRGESALSLREIASRSGFFDARHMKRALKRDGITVDRRRSKEP